ncbi:TrkH family potassium uptake protein [Massilia dura]|uniref:TrkH family potassium uptake protein n=1 Tax=Pseudoduganella dura TaxID=321982 RepID=A0A6I3XUE9_9BURK|nr:potassium transporter TrkG [Pseudoduganella dura]MUI15355.1 TrkH family potassium uptake protein [Pseudoduganella dura]GGX80541.1 potassium transporter Trk [Pseudoduganella dura]
MKQTVVHPARAVVLAFFLAILAGTVILTLPAARAAGEAAPLMVAFFTSVSAVCVTGLVLVDTGSYWSVFGQSAIMVLFQLGGFGMMTAATLLGLMVNRSPRLRTRLVTQTETRSLWVGDVSSVGKLVFQVTALSQLAIAAVLTLRMRFGHGMEWREAAWSGVFHAVSAFNNAGFSIHADGFVRYAGDALVLLPVMLASVVGGIGFPILNDLRQRCRDPRHWSLHTKLTLSGTLVLILGGFVAVLLFEWSNPATIGPFSVAGKLLNSLFISVSARTAGFNTVDIAALTRETWAMHYPLMFIGGGSAGTAGGVKVGTVAVLALLVIAEAKGHSDTEAFGRRVGASAQRQAITVLVVGSTIVAAGTVLLLRISHFPTDQVIFEVIAAFGSAGLSTGITADLPVAGQLVLALLMFFGRVGTITLATSLVIGERRMPYRYPEEHPIVG